MLRVSKSEYLFDPLQQLSPSVVYRIVGPPVQGPVLAPLTFNSSTTDYICGYVNFFSVKFDTLALLPWG